MEFTGPLWQSHVKLWRASALIPEVAAEIERYRLSDPVKPRCYEDEGELVIECASQGPMTVGAVIGDVFHNLRSALDLMACALVRENGGSDKDVYFPFADGKDRLEARIKAKNFDRAGAAAVGLLKQFRPYRGGDAALRAVHDYNVMDKHRAFIPTRYQFETRTVIGPINDQGERPIAVAVPPESIKLLFDGGPFDGDEIVPTLENLAELAHGVVEAFTLLLGENTPPD